MRQTWVRIPLFLLGFAGANAIASEVILTGKDSIAVSKRNDRAWELGDKACVLRNGREIACGSISKIAKRGAILTLRFQRERPAKGDEVKPGGLELLDTTNVDTDTTDFNFLATAIVSPNYFIPIGALWDPLESTCRHASLSIL